MIVTDGEVEIRYVMPTDRASEQVRFCHLRLAYFDPVVEPPAAAMAGEAPQPAVPLHLPESAGVALEPVGHDGPRHGRRWRRTRFSSSGAKRWTQRYVVVWSTSTPRSASMRSRSR